jgi:DNA (cytosine-5)-methyltransferase 1
VTVQRRQQLTRVGGVRQGALTSGRWRARGRVQQQNQCQGAGTPIREDRRKAAREWLPSGFHVPHRTKATQSTVPTTTVAQNLPHNARRASRTVTAAQWDVCDLFSGAGGFSLGFHAHPRFRIVAAIDAEIGKPSTGFGALNCNKTYRENIGIEPIAADLGRYSPSELRERLSARGIPDPTVICASPPCTGFSRTRAVNHIVDDPNNKLVGVAADFAEEFAPKVILIENARELLTGRFKKHGRNLVRRLESLGYTVVSRVHRLSQFGLPQSRERAVIVGTLAPLVPRTLDDLWDGYRISQAATTVRRAIASLPPLSAGVADINDEAHVSTAIRDPVALRRLKAIPHDGGSWADLIDRADAGELLIGAMQRAIEAGTLNHFCDVYGRMAWDKPAPTIKRECCHVGNGRYAHPDQDRICSVRELGILQGFPMNYRFVSSSRKNMYRHVGDAVPPLISYQLAMLTEWILTDVRPSIDRILLPHTHVTSCDIQSSNSPIQLRLAG